MNLRFSWYVSEAFKDNIPRPAAEMINPVIGCKGTLVCLLMDDGGSGHQNALAWIEEALEKIAAVKTQAIVKSEWNREAWGAKISIEGVQVFSLYDESYSDFMGLDSFTKALTEWRNFTQSSPDSSVSVEVLL